MISPGRRYNCSSYPCIIVTKPIYYLLLPKWKIIKKLGVSSKYSRPPVSIKMGEGFMPFAFILVCIQESLLSVCILSYLREVMEDYAIGFHLGLRLEVAVGAWSHRLGFNPQAPHPAASSRWYINGGRGCLQCRWFCGCSYCAMVLIPL